MALTPSNDLLSQMLIAQLLDEEMLEMSSAHFADQLQVNDALKISGGKSNNRQGLDAPHAEATQPVPDDDFQMALRLVANEARLASDAAFAENLQAETNTAFTMDFQYAQQLAAGEKKIALDAEFARSLQQAQESGDHNIDDPSMKNADGVVDRNVLDDLMASDPNSKGKGKRKGKGKSPDIDMETSSEADSKTSSSPYDNCGICMDPFQHTHSPISASVSANSSHRLQFGLRLPCPGAHGYCISCLSSYIRAKLDPDGEGAGNAESVVFPVICPECPTDDWPEGIPNEVAERVLDEKMMSLWYFQRLKDSMPHYYCPNPRCSVRVQIDEEVDEPQAECPACHQQLCIPCRSIWHDDMNCGEYQALPLEDRSPDDLLTLQVVKTENWRRCPSCSYIVELLMGCNHVTCRCKTEFCFKCGSLWNKRQSRCTSDPSCDLWEEDMLLEERERNRQRARALVAGQPIAHHVPVAANPPPAPPPYRAEVGGEFDWMADRAVLKLCSNRHPFTQGMIRRLACGYCGIQMHSLRELQIHLSLARHSVFACCGRLFSNESRHDQHLNAPARWGRHEHQTARIVDEEDGNDGW